MVENHTPGVLVRRLDAAERSVALDLRVAALSDAPAAFGSSVERERGLDADAWHSRLSTNAWFAAFDDDDAVGLACGVRSGGPDAVELTGMWVAPGHRGSGVADQLVEAVRTWALAQGARRLDLDVVATNQRAVDLYVRHGFQLVDSTDRPEAELRDGDVRMTVDLGLGGTDRVGAGIGG